LPSRKDPNGFLLLKIQALLQNKRAGCSMWIARKLLDDDGLINFVG